MPAKQRAGLDAVAGHAAATAAALQQKVQEAKVPSGRGRDVCRLHLAALRALTASVLAPAAYRAPFLPLALRLLRAVGPLVPSNPSPFHHSP